MSIYDNNKGSSYRGSRRERAGRGGGGVTSAYSAVGVGVNSAYSAVGVVVGVKSTLTVHAEKLLACDGMLYDRRLDLQWLIS